ncbi:hypothetical protein QTP88_008171 [Uroleucon formosanum]
MAHKVPKGSLSNLTSDQGISAPTAMNRDDVIRVRKQSISKKLFKNLEKYLKNPQIADLVANFEGAEDFQYEEIFKKHNQQYVILTMEELKRRRNLNGNLWTDNGEASYVVEEEEDK